jgi:hypothetical protein
MKHYRNGYHHTAALHPALSGKRLLQRLLVRRKLRMLRNQPRMHFHSGTVALLCIDKERGEEKYESGKDFHVLIN